jgi:type VI secretion system secreted protein Hcp
MSVDFFLKLDGVNGESKDSKHAGEIEILSFTWGVQQVGAQGAGGGGGAGKAAFQDLRITKRVDLSSPALMQVATTGKHIPKGVLIARKAGGEALEYLKIELEDILVSSVDCGGASGGPELTETTTLNFAKVKITYTEQTKEGKAGKQANFGYDLKAGKPT